jgi:hypothetical protein
MVMLPEIRDSFRERIKQLYAVFERRTIVTTREFIDPS